MKWMKFVDRKYLKNMHNLHTSLILITFLSKKFSGTLHTDYFYSLVCLGMSRFLGEEKFVLDEDVVDYTVGCTSAKFEG